MNGIFITVELDGDVARQVHALQQEFDPTMARYPFTPHCTPHLYPELTPDKLQRMLRVRVREPFTLRRLTVYHTQQSQAPRLLLGAALGVGGGKE